MRLDLRIVMPRGALHLKQGSSSGRFHFQQTLHTHPAVAVMAPIIRTRQAILFVAPRRT